MQFRFSHTRCKGLVFTQTPYLGLEKKNDRESCEKRGLSFERVRAPFEIKVPIQILSLDAAIELVELRRALRLHHERLYVVSSTFFLKERRARASRESRVTFETTRKRSRDAGALAKTGGGGSTRASCRPQFAYDPPYSESM